MNGKWGDGQDTISICCCTCCPLLSARGLINILRQQERSHLTSTPPPPTPAPESQAQIQEAFAERGNGNITLMEALSPILVRPWSHHETLATLGHSFPV